MVLLLLLARTREGSDPVDDGHSKNPRRVAEMDIPEQRDSSPQHSDPWRLSPQAALVPKTPAAPALSGPNSGASQGPNPGPSKDPKSDPWQGCASGDAVQRAPSVKRKEMAPPDPVEEMEMEDLESIMSQPMEEPEVLATPSKKQRLETAAQVKQEELSFAEVRLQVIGA